MPVSLKKTPAISSWKEYQRRLPEEAEVSIVDFLQAFAIICGGVSAILKNIDFDEKV